VDAVNAPEPPDPQDTAAAQGAVNRETAITQYGLGATNQRTPYGNLTYRQIGRWPDGTPRFEATTTMSPQQDRIYDEATELARRLGTFGNRQAQSVAGEMSDPFEFDLAGTVSQGGRPFELGNEQTESRLMQLGRARLDPLFAERRAALETRLANQGVNIGSEAWENAMRDFGTQENDAYNNLLLTGRGQAASEGLAERNAQLATRAQFGNEQLAERNQPLNEMIGLLSGTQVQQPTFQQTPQPGVAGVDYAGLVNNRYQAQAGNYQAMMGGLFGMGSAALGGWATGW
jgi:hypothetical protein